MTTERWPPFSGDGDSAKSAHLNIEPLNDVADLNLAGPAVNEDGELNEAATNWLQQAWVEYKNQIRTLAMVMDELDQLTAEVTTQLNQVKEQNNSVAAQNLKKLQSYLQSHTRLRLVIRENIENVLMSPAIFLLIILLSESGFDPVAAYGVGLSILAIVFSGRITSQPRRQFKELEKVREKAQAELAAFNLSSSTHKKKE